MFFSSAKVKLRIVLDDVIFISVSILEALLFYFASFELFDQFLVVKCHIQGTALQV